MLPFYMLLAIAFTWDDLFLTRMVGDFEDKILREWGNRGNSLPGGKRMTHEQILCPDDGWRLFFALDDQYFPVSGKFYLTQTREETANPFPFAIWQGLSFSDTCMVRTRGSLMAIQQEHGSSSIELWDFSSGKLLASIDNPFVVRQTNFAFTKSSLVLHTDYGAMSIYRYTLSIQFVEVRSSPQPYEEGVST